ncbi:MAG: 3-dehydroquinate dehydratase/shikimate dehydrogenase [Planctomycetota bacterium]
MPEVARYAWAMTLVACSVTVDRPDLVTPALERAAAARADGADLVEWRIDLLAMMPGADGAIARLVRDSPLPCILTVRSEVEGGAFDGSPVEAARVLAAAVRCGHPPRFIDAEARMLQDAHAGAELHAALATLDDGARPSLIVSMHDHAGRPASLWSSLERMWADRACSVAKVAWTARTLRDNLEAFDVLASRQGPTIALCMGEQGVLSRVMGAKFGAFLTFARLDDEEGTAPGQPTVRELVDRYRVKGITRHTRVYGIVGWPVAHSRGPIVHNAWFGQLGLDARYLPLPVGPSWESFKASMSELVDHPALDLAGVSVTLPHKEHLVRFVQERGGALDDASLAIGAANTLLIDPHSRSLRACNTDALAGIESLAEALGRASDDLRGLRVAILGAGGVARAMAWACANAGAQVVVINRTHDRAVELAASFDGRPGGRGPMRVEAGDAASIGCGCFHAFVNATPLGMKDGPAPDESPIPDDAALDGVVVMDTVYVPERTPLVQQATSRGARVVTGLGMFMRQAALQCELWTGTRPSTISAQVS